MEAVNHAFRCLILLLGTVLASCSMAPGPDTRPIPREVRKESMRWSSALIVTRNPAWRPRFDPMEDAIAIPDDAEGGSASPVSRDGYFLTASHVVDGDAGGIIYLWYGDENRWRVARVVWRDREADLALLHVPISTPGYYRWSMPKAWLPAGTRVFHVGIATGADGPTGKMLSDLAPERSWTGNRLFKMDMPLKPGDSGGAVLNRHGQLVGINSAVEFLVPMETAFFVDSEGSRPCVGKLEKIIEKDRATRAERMLGVE